MKKYNLKINLSKKTLEELKVILEENLEQKLYYMITPGFSMEHGYKQTKKYQERIKIMKKLVVLDSLYSKIIKILKE